MSRGHQKTQTETSNVYPISTTASSVEESLILRFTELQKRINVFNEQIKQNALLKAELEYYNKVIQLYKLGAYIPPNQF